MTIYISTNLYEAKQLPDIFSLVKKMPIPVGIELFPEWQSTIFEQVIEDYLVDFKKYKISLHGPYYQTEHSKKAGTAEYQRSMQYFAKTLQLSSEFGSKYIVYHNNNCKVLPDIKKEMIANSIENLALLRNKARMYNAQIVVENAGIAAYNNMLFNQQEFIEMAKSIPGKILLDIGHANANGWDIKTVMQELAYKIAAYHVHNNNGCDDNHNRILDGTLDFPLFLSWYKQYTPQADIVVEYGKQCAVDIEGIISDVKNIYTNIQYA